MWTLSNHDITRHVSRLGRAEIGGPVELFRKRSGPVEVELGRRRARALVLLELALPGGVYLYQGEELGLEEVDDLPEELLQDPTWERSGHTERGRDGCRVPLPWTTSGPSLGFGSGPGWLPQPRTWSRLSVQAQDGDPSSMLSLYRAALRLRHSLRALGAGSGRDVQWLELGNDVVAFSREPGFTFVLNTGSDPVELPDGEVLLASAPPPEGRLLPGDAAAWVATR
jgi:alpha-glucosidase